VAPESSGSRGGRASSVDLAGPVDGPAITPRAAGSRGVTHRTSKISLDRDLWRLAGPCVGNRPRTGVDPGSTNEGLLRPSRLVRAQRGPAVLQGIVGGGAKRLTSARLFRPSGACPLSRTVLAAVGQPMVGNPRRFARLAFAGENSLDEQPVAMLLFCSSDRMVRRLRHRRNWPIGPGMRD
jgi:hypothetical protein